MSKKFAIATVVLTLAAAPAFAQTTNPQTTPQNPPRTQTQPQTPPKSTQAPAKTDQTNQTAMHADQQFVKTVAMDNMAEAELGKLAAEKSSRDDVKQFAQKMVDDHSKANDELKSIATGKNMMWPDAVDAQHKAVHDRLSKLSGAAFDRSYVNEMVAGHRKAVAAFKMEAASGKDAEVKAWASKTLPTIEEHYKQAEALTKGAVGTTGTKPTAAKPAPPANPTTTQKPQTPSTPARPSPTDQPPTRP